MERRIEVEGYRTGERIGGGLTGEVWRARDLTTGETVALKRLRPQALAVVVRLQREAAELERLGGGHLVRVCDVVVDRDVVLVTDYAPGGSLADLLHRRGWLDAGALVTVLAPLAQLLASAHQRGLVHGDLTPSNVLFAADGRPLLADFGIALAMDLVAGEPSATADVYSLAEIGHAALAELAGDVPAGLVTAIEAGLGPAGRRPNAAAFAAALLASCPAAPVRLTAAPLPPLPPTTSRTAPPVEVRRAPRPERPAATPPPARARPRAALRRLTAWAVAVVATLALAAAGGTAWAHLSRPAAGSLRPPSAVPSRPPSPAADPTTTKSPATRSSWFDVVASLDATRSRAFATADAALLSEVYAPTAPGLVADASAVRSLASRGLRASGFAATVRRVRLLSTAGRRVRLRVTDTLAGYVLLNGSGKVVGSGSARRARTFTMTLIRNDGRWLVAAVADQTSAASAASTSE